VTVDTQELAAKVQGMYRQVAERPRETYHFEMGRPLADRLGYDAALLSGVPSGAVESFAGVGHFFDLAALTEGERVIDLGSGSGTDSFLAALQVGPTGRVVGVDFTPEQLTKARQLAEGWGNVEFREGVVERLPVSDGSFDCVISNGVVNLSPDKSAVFAEVARVLRPGGRLAIADIVTGSQLTDAIVADADLWASCIGGAAQEDDYRHAIEAAGLRIRQVRPNDYQFISQQARDASATFGVKSVCILAVKDR
jgi:ubiquinone/menaquinone biosynthesis C-methylase UbiE